MLLPTKSMPMIIPEIGGMIGVISQKSDYPSAPSLSVGKGRIIPLLQ
jgi:hypothetical protein